MSGATLSIATSMYKAGFKGRCEGGGEPGSNGRRGEIRGGGRVRRLFCTMDMICIVREFSQ